MNTQNINVADLVEQLIGGVMLLDTALPAQASQVVVPSGVKMTANGALGVLNEEKSELANDEQYWNI